MLRYARTGPGAVILGRAAAVVLAGEPGALHVRLDGPVGPRIEQAAALGGLSTEDAQRAQRQSDRARESYVRQLYRVDPRDPRHYHLVLDSTKLPLDACVDLIVAAAAGRVPAPA
jgi:cytidylate kinase